MTWRDWCESEGYGLGEYAHELVLAEDANVLHLSSANDLDIFTARYGVPMYADMPKLHSRSLPTMIDWERVACEAVDEPGGYAGLIIAPYVWSRRLENHTHWYYGWDCASGIIWDLAAVPSLTYIGESITRASIDGT